MSTSQAAWERIHGRPEPPAPAMTLAAGPVEALLDGIDVRYVRAGGAEAVRRVYVAVRDVNWNTIPADVSDLRITERDGGFEATFSCRHRHGDIDFRWEGSIVGEPDGSITYRMDGRAESEFDFNRIGFCVLHPFEESRDAAYRGITEDGEITGRLPDLIEPQRFEDGRYVALFDAVSDFEVELPGDGRVSFAFEGDLFEMEDQRNWTDASHKTYGTPLRLGYPHRARPGDRIAQAVRIRVQPPAAPQPSGGAGAELTLAAATGERVGRLGLGAPTHRAALSERHVELLRALAPDHLRADVRLADRDHRATLRRVLDDCARLGCGLELVLYLMEDDADLLSGVVEELGGVRPVRVLVFAADASSPGARETTPGSLVALVRARLGFGDVAIGGGTDMYFCELNRTRPDAGAMDVVAWSVNPQVHAFDDRSIMETPAAQAETVRTARSFSGPVPLAVTPVTLKPRFNANATRPDDGPSSGELPVPVDPRQASLFAAAWTVASLKRLLEAGVASATYFEPIGWRGLIELAEGAPLPDRFPSQPGMVFPLYHVFADLAKRRGDAVHAVDASDDLRVTALAVRGAGGLRVLAANLTAEEVSVRLGGLEGASATVRILDAGTVEAAATSPEQFRRDVRPAAVQAGALELRLGAYGVATIDLAEERA
jgi:hypothetical protein